MASGISVFYGVSRKPSNEIEEEPDDVGNLEVKMHKEGMKKTFQNILKHIRGVEATVKGMETFCRTKKSMFLPIKDGISEMRFQLERFRTDTKWVESWADSFEYYLGIGAGKRTQELAEKIRVDDREESCQTARGEVYPGLAETAPIKEEEWHEVPPRKNLRKQKPEPEAKKPEWPRGACPETVLIKPSNAAILRDFEKRVKPDELDVTDHGIRETRSKNLLVELKCSKEGKGRRDTAFKEVIGASGTVRHLIPRIEVEIADGIQH